MSACACHACCLALPYGAKTEPVEEFGFEEDTDGHKGEKYAWMNAAYAMAANINRAFKEYGWCARIRGVQSGGEVEELPTHTFPTDDGGVDLKCPTEIAISDRREAELAKSGTDPAHSSQEHRPRRFHRRPVALQAESLSEQSAKRQRRAICRRACPTCSPCCRFAHYLKVMVRDKVGSYYEDDAAAALAEQLDQRICRRRSRRTPRKRPSAAGRSPAQRSRSCRTRKTPATTRRRSSSDLTSSLRAWTSDCGSSRDCPSQKISPSLNPDLRAGNQHARLA